jgi:hypothetical protein
MLTLNSSGEDSHPIKRGVWLLERLLNDPPPPPPPAVPALAEGDDSAERLSLKARLEAHRQEDACMTCHRKIDPWGVAFENYDGIGRWRDSSVGRKAILEEASTKKKPVVTGDVDPQTTLADGTRIPDLNALKRYLLETKKDQFTETVVRKVMAYALGRYLDFTDTDSVKAIHARFAADDYRMRGLITSIVLSEPFLTK